MRPALVGEKARRITDVRIPRCGSAGASAKAKEDITPFQSRQMSVTQPSHVTVFIPVTATVINLVFRHCFLHLFKIRIVGWQ